MGCRGAAAGNREGLFAASEEASVGGLMALCPMGMRDSWTYATFLPFALSSLAPRPPPSFHKKRPVRTRHMCSTACVCYTVCLHSVSSHLVTRLHPSSRRARVNHLKCPKYILIYPLLRLHTSHFLLFFIFLATFYFPTFIPHFHLAAPFTARHA